MDTDRAFGINWFGNIEDTLMSTDKKLILGLGKTGYSFAEYLSAKGEAFDFADTRSLPADLNRFKSAYGDAEFYLGNLNEEILDNYTQLLLSPGVDMRHDFVRSAQRKNIDIQSDISIFISELDAKIVGVTGSNGKSTLTAMLGHALSELDFNADIGGNIGIAALSLLNKSHKEIYILELSSFQLDIRTDLPMHAAVVLNVTEDHLDRYDTFEDYVNSKASIYKCAETKIINLDDPYCAAMQNEKNDSTQCFTFSMQNAEADFHFDPIVNAFFYKDKKIIDKDAFLLKGEHNYQNILAALAVAHSIQVDLQDFANAMSTFSGLPHRCEYVARINEVEWINDSKATNLAAALAAINGIKSPLHLIMGGDAKGADFSSLQTELPAYVKSICLIGEDANVIADSIPKHIPTYIAPDMAAAIGVINMEANPDEIALLSPACASFDMYKNYQERGDDFKQKVLGLEK